MIHKIQRFCLVVTLTAFIALPAVAQEAAHGHTMVDADGLAYADIQPEGFDPGMKIAVLLGDPDVADEQYVLRLSFPTGYRFPAHYHPKAENLTVLSGELLLGVGSEADDSKMKSYMPGDFIHIEPENPHYGGAKSETIIQLHGFGPFQVMLPEAKAKTAGM